MSTTRKKSGVRLKLTLIIMVLVLVLVSLGFAWYSFYTKHADTKNMQIMTPYALYLLNSGATDTLELSVGGIHPGESKQVVVCVSSHDANQEEEARKGEFPYTLELVHTENIGLEFKLYELTPISKEDAVSAENVIESEYSMIEKDSETGDENTIINTAYFSKNMTPLSGDTSKTTEYQDEMYGENASALPIVNLGKYCIYENADFKLSLNDSDQWHDYYLIEISWLINDTSEHEEIEQSKETDLVYLVAKAGVAEPYEIE